MKNSILLMLSYFVLTGCLAGGGGGSSSGGTAPELDLDVDYDQTTIETSTNYMKAEEDLVITVTPKTSSGTEFDIKDKWDFTIFPLCYACVNGSMPAISKRHFTKVGNKFVYTYTPEDSSKVGFSMRFERIGTTKIVDKYNDLKHTVEKYEPCIPPVRADRIFRLHEKDGVEYNVICDNVDFFRIDSTPTFQYFRGSSETEAQRIMRIALATNGKFILGKDITIEGTFILPNGFTGEFNGNNKKVTVTRNDTQYILVFGVTQPTIPAIGFGGYVHDLRIDIDTSRLMDHEISLNAFYANMSTRTINAKFENVQIVDATGRMAVPKIKDCSNTTTIINSNIACLTN